MQRIKNIIYIVFSVILLSELGISSFNMKSPIYSRHHQSINNIIGESNHYYNKAIHNAVKIVQDEEQLTPRWTSSLSLLMGGEEEQRLNALHQLGSENYSREDKLKVSNAVCEVLLKDKSPVVRALAAGTLEQLHEPSAIIALKASLDIEQQPAVKKAVVYAIASYKDVNDPQIVTKLIPLLKDSRRELRASAAYALAEVGDNQASPELIKLLRRIGKESDSFAKSQAARALGRVAPKGDPDTVEALTKALKSDDSHDVKREAARALGTMALAKDLKAIEELQKAQLSSDPYLAQIADESLLLIVGNKEIGNKE